ncbi:hypothetical protein FRC02_011764 [Tulasnella sp. 418]|nr:hypothetical protein FRC02_011764 [Tulasnella sp. 418]
MAVNNSEFVLNQASTSSQSTGDSTTEPTWESLLPMFDTLTNLMSTMTPAERQAIMPRLEKLDGALDDLMLVACGKSFDDTVLPSGGTAPVSKPFRKHSIGPCSGDKGPGKPANPSVKKG